MLLEFHVKLTAKLERAWMAASGIINTQCDPLSPAPAARPNEFVPMRGDVTQKGERMLQDCGWDHLERVAIPDPESLPGGRHHAGGKLGHDVVC